MPKPRSSPARADFSRLAGYPARSAAARTRSMFPAKAPASIVMPSALRWGNVRTMLRRRSSAGSIPVRRDARSTSRSIA